MRRWLALAGLSVTVTALAVAGARGGGEAGEVAGLLARAEIRGGFAVHVGATDGRMEETLRQDGRFLVHGLADDAEAVAAARRHLSETGFYGQVSVEWRNDLERLPYADNLVNLIVADLDRLGKRAPETAEIERALAPLGALILKRDGQWRLTRKPWPETMGEWTHPWGDAGNNPVAQDTEMGVPTGIRWIVGPEATMGERKSSDYSFLSAAGRVFVLTQNVAGNLGFIPSPPRKRYPPYYIMARDAFNGLFLWKRPYEGPGLGQASVNRRMVATSDRLYVVTGDRLLGLDAATGEKQTVYPTENVPAQLLFHEGRLLAACFNAVTAYDPDTAEILWRAETGYPARRGGQNILSAAAHGDGLYVLIRGEGRHSRFVAETPHEIWSLAVRDGRERWRRRLEGSREETPGIYHDHMRIGLAGDGFFGLIALREFHAMATGDGAVLWLRDIETRPDKGHVDQRSVGHFYSERQGVIWLRMPDGGWLEVDPKSGTEGRKIAGSGIRGCGRIAATSRYAIFGRHSRVFDLDDGQEHVFHFGRNTCGIGMVPANGLLYSGPNSCPCSWNWVRGYVALDSAPVPSIEETEAAPLQKGARFGTYDQAVAQPSAGWPSYRANTRRSATTPQGLPDDIEPLWETAVAEGEPERSDREWALKARSVLTAPVAANGRVYLAHPRGHRVVALAANSGEQAWEYIADGRVDSPPTVHGPLVLFGSHDGRVTCLDAATGELVWRRRVAPGPERVMAHGQLASRWPVSGSVLVQDDVAFAAAGRTSHVDGGVFATALDVWTGEIRWRMRLESGVGLSDILVSDGKSLALMQRSIDPVTGAIGEPADAVLGNTATGLLNATWTRIWKGNRWRWGTGWIHAMNYGGIASQLLAFDGNKVLGYEGPRGRTGTRRVFAREIQEPAFAPPGRGARHEPVDGIAWEFEIEAPRQIEALIRAGQSVLAAGPHDWRAAPDTKGFVLRLAADGQLLQEMDLASPPVYEGMAAADQRLYIATQDGRVHAFGRR